MLPKPRGRAGTADAGAAHLGQVDGHELAGLRLGKKTEALYERAVELTRQLDRYSYGATVRFSDTEVDQARAAGVVIEFDRGYPLIVDRALYRELVKQAIARTVDELEVKVAERAAEKKASRGRTADQPADPVADVRREEQRQLRELSERAHGVNLDLGAGLLTGLATVDPSDMDVARAFVLGRCRPSTNWADVATMPRRCLDCWRRVRRRASGSGERGDCRHSYPRLSR